MSRRASLIIGRFLITPALVLVLTGCAFFSDGVVTAVESHYITSKREILSVSGETASHPLYGVFQVDNPPLEGKSYRNDDGNATLSFRTNGARQQAIIEFADKSPNAVFDAHFFGGQKKSTVLGIFW